MKTRTSLTILTLTLAVGLAGAAAAQSTLWDQTEGYESWTMGFFNVIAGSPPFGLTVYTVNDVVVPGGGWTVNTVKVYFDGFNPGWAGAVTNATLYIEPKTSSMPIGDPSTGTAVTVETTILGNNFMEVAATGLSVALTEGEWWIGLTPNAPNADNIHVSVAAVGDDSPSYDAYGFPMPMWTTWAPGLDGAMLIEGEPGAVSSEAASWGEVKSLFR